VNPLIRTSLLAAVLAVGLEAVAQIDAPPATETPEAVEVYRARAGDDMALRQYAWATWIQLFRDGVLRNQTILKQTYLSNGRMQRVIQSQDHAALPGGFVARTEEEDEYLTELQDLLETYRPTSGALMNFLSATKITGPDSSGALSASGKNVVKQGDSVTVWWDAKTRQLRRLQVKTIFRKDPILVEATFAKLPQNGPSYLQYVQVDIPAKKAQLLIHHYDYRHIGDQ
jgi:hypothetical protein